MSLIREVPGDPLETPELQLQPALRDCAALDAAAEPAFDRIAAPSAQVLDMPMALAGSSDRNRKWFTSRVDFAAAEIAREFSFQGSVAPPGSAPTADYRVMSGLPVRRDLASIALKRGVARWSTPP
jgi:hypothetical protein